MNTRLAVTCFGVTVLVACTSPMPVTVPDALKAGAGESLAMIVPAKGVQIYECRAKKGFAGEYEWAFVAPEADLFDGRGRTIGKHGAGPYWQAADGSKLMGSLKERADAPIAGAIPWLLMAAKTDGPQGAFSNVRSIQRVNTVGGVAPAAGCNRNTTGTAVRVDYTADYYFYGKE